MRTILLTTFLFWIGIFSGTSPLAANDIGVLLEKEKGLSKVSDPHERILYLYKLSEDFYEVDQLKHQKYFDEGFSLAKSLNNSIWIGYHYGMLSMRAFNREDYSEAIHNAAIASQQLLEGGDTASFFNSEYVRAVSYYNLELPEIAEQIIIDAAKLDRHIRFPVEQGKMIIYLAHIHRDRRDPATPEVYRRASKLFKAGNDYKWTFALYRGLASYYAGTAHSDSAIHYGKKTIALIRQNEPFNKLSFISTAYFLSALLHTEGHYDEAIALLKEAGLRSVDLTLEGIELINKAKQVNYLFVLRQKARIQNLLAFSGLLAMLLFGSITLFYYHRIRKQKQQLDQANDQLHVSLEQNKILLRETQHRVKNNYQMIMSMLSIHQTRSGQTIGEFVNQSNSRIAAMAKVHELLYQQQELSKLPLQDYLSDVVNTTLQSMISLPGNIKVRIESHQLKFDLNTTLLLGLIVNELLINSIKHVFTRQEQGSIEIEIIQLPEQCVLYYRDSGPGIEEQLTKQGSTGLSLIQSLARQLSGSANYEAGAKWHSTILFQPG